MPPTPLANATRLLILGALAALACGEPRLPDDPYADLGQPPRPSREVRPAVSPDGRYLAFNSDRGGVFDIYVMDLPTGEIRQLTKARGHNYLPRWSPDGSRISFYSNYFGNPWAGDIEHDVFVMNADGSDVDAVVGEPSQDMFADWLPGGGGLVYASTRGSSNHIRAPKSLYTIDLATGAINGLLPDDFDVPVFQPSVHLLSGDIVFEGNADGNSDLWLLVKETGELRRLTTTQEDEFGPSISPDGMRVLFQASHGGGQIGLVNLDGTGYQVVTEGGRYVTPAWMPDGRIATVFTEPDSEDPVLGNWNLYTLNADGTGLDLLLAW